MWRCQPAVVFGIGVCHWDLSTLQRECPTSRSRRRPRLYSPRHNYQLATGVVWSLLLLPENIIMQFLSKIYFVKYLSIEDITGHLQSLHKRFVCWVTYWAVWSGASHFVVLLYVCIFENCKCTGHDNKSLLNSFHNNIIFCLLFFLLLFFKYYY